MKRSPATSAFTLVELLVVVAVVGLLAAMMAPALRRARQTANSTTCVNNLRQLGLAAQMYWADHDHNPFPYKAGAVDGGDVYWFGWLQRGAEGARDFDAARGMLFPYVRGTVRLCPELNYALAEFKMKAKGAAHGYGYNLQLAPSSAGRKLKMNELARPSNMALLADAAQVNTFQAPASPDRPMLEEFYYLNPGEATAHFRHGRTAMAVFCDGHAAAHAPAPGTLDARLPHAAVAELPPEMLRP